MIRLGLTGSIGMGKSTTAKIFESHGVPVYDADASVHKLYTKGGAAIEPIGAIFPDAVREGAIDRAILREKVVGKPEEMARLEKIIHPLTAQARQDFILQAIEEKARLAVFDIPLLFETKSQSHFDCVVVVSAPFAVQKQRVLARGEMDETQFSAILAKQIPDWRKRAEADFIIQSQYGLDYARIQVHSILQALSFFDEGVRV